ncbi:MAG: prolyl oligopeptidase family serine peptidase [Terriglobales bacterium]
MRSSRMRGFRWLAVLILLVAGTIAAAQARRLESADLLKMKSVGSVAISPDGARIAYTVVKNDVPRRPLEELWVMTVADGKSVRISGGSEDAGAPEWSPDGRWIAYSASAGGKKSLFVARPDGTGERALAEVVSTNSPLTYEGRSIAWSPDAGRVAFVSATPGPEAVAASGDPVVITRYLYKPDYVEGNTRFNDNRRRHIFIADVATGSVQQATSGNFEERSIDWSPDGAAIAFISNREPNPDLFYNPDIFTLRVSDGSIRRITATENAEFQPRWSPDGKTIAYLGTRRGLTDLETDMEDTHVWLVRADGSQRRELGSLDNRQASPTWAADGSALFASVQERGSVRLYRFPVTGAPTVVIQERGRVDEWSVARTGSIAYAYASPADSPQLYVRNSSGQSRQLTSLNAELLRGVAIAEVEPFTFISNDNQFEVEAFLTKPVGMTADSRHPLIVMIHGGPHWFQGPAFDFRSQYYAHQGWATLKVNYRGSTSYGQKFSDAVFRDQNGDEAQDVLYGVSAAVRRNLWIDRERLGIEGGSYGGQLSTWLITQTHIFKAAIPLAPITNIISYNYMTYYNMYEQMEWGALPHQANLMDVLWERSALKHVAKVKTPTMLIHGENDNDVPIAESEQFFIALQDVGVEAVFVRYPREGHGLREPHHIVDLMDRSAAWYRKHFGMAP